MRCLSYGLKCMFHLFAGKKAEKDSTFDFLVVQVWNIQKFSDDIDQIDLAEELLTKAAEIKQVSLCKF